MNIWIWILLIITGAYIACGVVMYFVTEDLWASVKWPQTIVWMFNRLW